MKNSFTYLYTFKTSIVIGVLMLFASCKNDMQEVQGLELQQDTALISAENIEMNYTINGKTNVKMMAPLYNQFPKPNEDVHHIFPKGIEIIFFDQEKGTTSSLQANYSIFYEKDGIWEAQYDVIAVNEKGEQLNTEYLVWKRDLQTISTDKFVKMSTADGVIFGDGMVANQNFTSWEIINGRGIINIDENE